LARAEDEDDDPKWSHSVQVSKRGTKPEPKPPKASRAEPEPPAEPAVRKAKAAPKDEPEPAYRPPLVDPFPVPGRSVRVRLLDGSSVAGTVRAELSESLVIDCAMGLLSIPRVRIYVITYDAGEAKKRAPVQQLDDELPPRRR
jgi:hypothetical protein